MPNLFTPRADFRFRLVLALVVLGILSVIIVPMIYVRTPYSTEEGITPIQPVEFDHRHHVRDDGIECLYCHDGADRSPRAGIPPAELCMGCHNQVRHKDPTLEPVRRSYFQHEPIVWQRVHHLPDFVFFNHAIHTARGISCARCHGEVEDMPWVRKVYPMTMGWCLECHDPTPMRAYGHFAGDVLGPSHCSACHR